MDSDCKREYSGGLSPQKKMIWLSFSVPIPDKEKDINKICCQGYATHKIKKKIKALDQLRIHFLLDETKLLPEIILCYNQIHTVTDSIWKGAVKGLWKKRVGGDPWTPAL